METTQRKITAKVVTSNNIGIWRPPSPTKSYSFQGTPSPTVRPKAKVNSSATPTTLKKAVKAPISTVSTSTKRNGNLSTANSGPSISASTTPRAVSPVRPPFKASTPSPAPAKALLRTNLKLQTSHSQPGTPQAAMFSSHGSANDLNRRRSFTSDLGPRLERTVEDSSPTPLDAGPRIKSKVSNLAIHHEIPHPTSPAPTQPQSLSKPTGHRSRTPSTSSGVSADQTVYPITTATSAANPHRYVTYRHHTSSSGHFRRPTFDSSEDDTNATYTLRNTNIVTKVDPAFIPLPAHSSPPTSTLSFSSRSSASRSSFDGSSSPSNVNGANNLHIALENLVHLSSISPLSGNSSGDSSLGNDETTDGDVDEEMRSIRTEAKTNRKIADLEITNKSLLAINASLEATKHRQAKEIRELRRKLRESRLILPPHTFRAVKATETEEETEDNEDEDNEDNEDIAAVEGDEPYQRLKLVIDGLIDTGKRALETKVSDFLSAPKGGAKVLSAEEVRNWGRDRARSPVSPAFVAIPDSGSEFESEDEVANMTLSTSRSPSPPPILITESA